MSTRDRWLDEGLAVLAEQGAAGVRVDRVAARLGLTKGSFHHHFNGADDYRRAILERHERDQLAALAELAEELDAAHPGSEFALLSSRALALLDADRERAVRAWSLADPAARAVQERLDNARLELLERLWRRHLADPGLARTAALLPHLVTAGLSVVHPRPAPAEIGDVFALLATLAPDVIDDA